VLSTPPAFVLSQDQTLQQKLALTKASTNGTGPASPPKPNQNWHNTTSSETKQARHTVEFSKDTRTPSRSR
jgi:hypothetical protein